MLLMRLNGIAAIFIVSINFMSGCKFFSFKSQESINFTAGDEDLRQPGTEATVQKVSIEVSKVIEFYKSSGFVLAHFDDRMQDYYRSLVATYVTDARLRLGHLAYTSDEVKQLEPILSELLACEECMSDNYKDKIDLRRMKELAGAGDDAVTSVDYFSDLGRLIRKKVDSERDNVTFPSQNAAAIEEKLRVWMLIPKVGNFEREGLRLSVTEGRKMLEQPKIGNRELYSYLDGAVRASNNWQHSLVEKKILLNKNQKYSSSYLRKTGSFGYDSHVKETILKMPEFVIYLPTFQNLSASDFNKLTPYPIFLLGLTRRIEVKYDGLTSGSAGFLMHDLGHVVSAATMSYHEFFPGFYGTENTKPVAQITKLSHEKFKHIVTNRETIFARFERHLQKIENPTERYMAELLWFFVLHESVFDIYAWSPESALQMPGFSEFLKRSFELISQDPTGMDQNSRQILKGATRMDFKSQADLLRVKEISKNILSACEL
jgi:hypothetical protein